MLFCHFCRSWTGFVNKASTLISRSGLKPLPLVQNEQKKTEYKRSLKYTALKWIFIRKFHLIILKNIWRGNFFIEGVTMNNFLQPYIETRHLKLIIIIKKIRLTMHSVNLYVKKFTTTSIYYTYKCYFIFPIMFCKIVLYNIFLKRLRTISFDK